jgi:nitrilase
MVGSRTPEGRKLYRRYVESAISIPGPEASLLAATAADLGIYLAVGVIERDQRATSTVYCTLALWGPDGTLLNVHRKIKPTASERLIWGEGDGSGLRTIPTDMGRVGGLICWENYMPLARSALYAQGVEIYLAPTADGRETWQSTIRHIALEGRCFVLACNQYMTKAEYPTDLDDASLQEIAAMPDPMVRGGSAIIGPLGEYLAGPLWDERGILYAEIDPGTVAEARFDFDACGHYSRPDLLRLQNRTLPPQASRGVLPAQESWREVLAGGDRDGELSGARVAQLGPGSLE